LKDLDFPLYLLLLHRLEDLDETLLAADGIAAFKDV